MICYCSHCQYSPLYYFAQCSWDRKNAARNRI